MLFRYALFLALGLSAMAADAQQERPYRKFATQQVHQRLLSEYTSFSTALAGMESQISNHGSTTGTDVDTIPVVFHILHTAEQSYPPEAQILAQLDLLNSDFQNYHAPDTPYVLTKVQELENLGTDPTIFFCLAASNGTESVTPISYVETTVEEWNDLDSMKYAQFGGADARNPDRVLNIWIGYLADGYAGYAQMPGGPSATDGIVLDLRYLPQPIDTFISKVYDQGKTLTHLVGSYLGLYELWNDQNPCQDDFVDDTPIHNVPNYFPGEIFYHISLCDTTRQTEMIMNFMDNTDDRVLNMFTQGQKDRMKAILAQGGIRHELSNSAVICSPDSLWVIDDRTNKSIADNNHVLRLHPNPANQSINIQLQSLQTEKVNCSVYNFQGVLIWNNDGIQLDKSGTIQLDCSRWNEGEYIAIAVFENGEVLTQKFSVVTP